MSQPAAPAAAEVGSTTIKRLEWLMDETLLENFPASDPPCWSQGCDRPAVGGTARLSSDTGDTQGNL